MSSSIFANDRTLRSQYAERAGTELQSATSVITAIRLAKFNQNSKAFYLENNLNVDVTLMLVKPENDPDDPTRRSEWVKIGAGKVLNFDLASVNLMIDGGAFVYLYCASAPTNSAIKLRLFTWG